MNNVHPAFSSNHQRILMHAQRITTHWLKFLFLCTWRAWWYVWLSLNVIHLLCSPTFAHIFCMFINVSVFPRVNGDDIRTPDQRQSIMLGTSRAYALNSLRLFQLHIHDAQSMHESIRNNNWSPDREKRSGLVTNAQRVSNAKGEWTARC